MAKWSEEQRGLKKNHGWKARPGNKIFVADRGAVRFDYPGSWLVDPTSDSIHFRDKPEPNDDCLMQVSVWYLRDDVDWHGLPLQDLIREVRRGDRRGLHAPGPIQYEQRGELEIAWIEHKFVDPVEKREAIDRACLARQGIIMPFITMVMWPEHREKFDPVWREVLRTLQLGRYIEDPTKGPVLH